MTDHPKMHMNAEEGYTSLPPRSFFLYGDPKVGKTWAAASFPAPLIMNFTPENGTSEIKGKKIWDYSSPKDVLEVLTWFKAGRHDFSTIVWDGFTNFVLVTAQTIQREKNYFDARRAHADTASEILPLIGEFIGMREHFRIITGHARRDTEFIDVKKEGGGTFNGIQVKAIYPDLPPRIRGYLLGFLDVYGFCFRGKSGERMAHWHPVDPADDQAFKYKPSGFKRLEAGTRLPLPAQTPLSFEAIEKAVIVKAVQPANNGRQPAPVSGPAQPEFMEPTE